MPGGPKSGKQTSISKFGKAAKPHQPKVKLKGTLKTSYKTSQETKGSGSRQSEKQVLQDGGYSLYSTDSEDPLVATNKDLDRCAQLLNDILGKEVQKTSKTNKTSKIKDNARNSHLSKFPGDGQLKGTIFNRRLVSSTPQRSNVSSNKPAAKTKQVLERGPTYQQPVRHGLKHDQGKFHGKTIPPPRPSVKAREIQTRERERHTDFFPVRGSPSKEKSILRVRFNDNAYNGSGDGLLHGIDDEYAVDKIPRTTTPVTQIQLEQRRHDAGGSLQHQSLKQNLFKHSDDANQETQNRYMSDLGNTPSSHFGAVNTNIGDYEAYKHRLATGDHLAAKTANDLSSLDKKSPFNISKISNGGDIEFPKPRIPNGSQYAAETFYEGAKNPSFHKSRLSLDSSVGFPKPRIPSVENDDPHGFVVQNWNPAFKKSELSMDDKDNTLMTDSQKGLIQNVPPSPSKSDASSDSTITSGGISGVSEFLENIEDDFAMQVPVVDTEVHMDHPAEGTKYFTSQQQAVIDYAPSQESLDLALQPLRSENSQLRRRLRILNQQLRQMNDAAMLSQHKVDVNFEMVHLQATNAGLKKQVSDQQLSLRKMEQDIRSLEDANEILRQEKEKILSILSDKDNNHLKSIQEWSADTRKVKEQLSIERASMKCLEDKLESLQGENHILTLTLNQRNEEIKKLKHHLEEEYKRGRSNSLRAWLASSMEGALTMDSLKKHDRVHTQPPQLHTNIQTSPPHVFRHRPTSPPRNHRPTSPPCDHRHMSPSRALGGNHSSPTREHGRMRTSPSHDHSPSNEKGGIHSRPPDEHGHTNTSPLVVNSHKGAGPSQPVLQNGNIDVKMESFVRSKDITESQGHSLKNVPYFDNVNTIDVCGEKTGTPVKHFDIRRNAEHKGGPMWSSSAKKETQFQASHRQREQIEAFPFSELDSCLSSIDDTETTKSVSSMSTTLMDQAFQDGLAQLDENILRLQKNLRSTYNVSGSG